MLVGKKVILRPFRAGDLEGLHDLTADVRKAGEFWPLGMASEQKMLEQFEENGWWTDDCGRLLITDRAGRRLGMIIYYQASHSYQGLELGYRIFQPADRGKGLMGEAIPLVVAYLFATRHVERIQLVIESENDASCKLAETCGFTREGMLRRAHYNWGTFHDLAVYAVLRPEATPLTELLAPL